MTDAAEAIKKKMSAFMKSVMTIVYYNPSGNEKDGGISVRKVVPVEI